MTIRDYLKSNKLPYFQYLEHRLGQFLSSKYKSDFGYRPTKFILGKMKLCDYPIEFLIDNKEEIELQIKSIRDFLRGDIPMFTPPPEVKKERKRTIVKKPEFSAKKRAT